MDIGKILKDNAAIFAKDTAHNILTWEWTKKLLHWLIISAGTVSECVFLIASLWMSVNASVHPLVLLAISEQTSQHLSELATAAYVALPELILGLAVVVTIGHVRTWLYDKRDYRSAIWVALYGLPTMVFLVLSLVTLGCSVTSVDFRMPDPLIVVRALAGYMFAFTSLLYAQLGVPQERDRLAEKDAMIEWGNHERDNAIDLLRQEKDAMETALRNEKDTAIASLRHANTNNVASLRNEKDVQIIEAQKQINELTEELARANATIEMRQKQITLLANGNNNGSEAALEAYSEECKTWLTSDAKTANIETIMQFTGHAKRTITNAIRSGKLQTTSRNKELVLMSSLIKWLECISPPASKDEMDMQKFIPFPVERASNGNGMLH